MPEFDLIQDDTGIYRTKSPSRKFWIIAMIIGIAAFIIGILIGKYAACDTSSPPAEVPVRPEKDGVFLPGVSDAIIKEADLSIRDLLLKNIDHKNIETYLKALTEKPHIAGSPEDEDTLVNYIKEFWENVGFDDVQTATYDILLSYPDKDNPNMIELLNENDEVIYQTPIEEDILTPGKNNTEGIPPFNAYSPKGIVTGQLVYVNYGRVEDYIHLESVGVNVSGCLAIARYGKIFRGSKVDIAQRHGVIGLILYSDPKDYAIPGEGVYPDTWWLPGSGAQRGTIFTGEGDPLTPGYPAIDTAYRYQEDKTIPPLPRIPAHPIGYTVAEQLLLNLTGATVTGDWKGGINITYKYGPGFINNNWKVRMNISTQNARRNTTNVIGFIKGAVEPDRYVIFGNHRDAWVYGAIDPSSATAVMMETSRVMGALVKSGKWRPRRTILFCSWGAEEYGMIGSTEWVEEYIKNIKERTVAYINIDISVEGTNTLRSKTTPLLYSVMYETVKLVENPNATEIAAGRKTVYDTWLLNRPWKINGEIYGKPEMQSMGSASDFAPILQKAGVTSVDFRYTYDKNLPVVGYPLYHSQYETFYAMKNLIDVDFKGQLVYVNYGRVEDYTHLDSVGVNVTGCVAIARYGKIFRGSMVDIAQKHGVIGLIIYSDPADYAVPGEGVYPDTWWLPGSGAQRGTIFTGQGDPLTPGYPAIGSAYRYEEDKVEPPLPKIPAHPIGYTVAEQLLVNLGGAAVVDKWKGDINITYRYGPGFLNDNWKVRMNISTQRARRNSSNVIGIIKGAVEPDRYVIFGNHRDAWVYGAIDPSSGTATMMETARAMAALVKSGKWRPRRTVLFCSWGAEEYGLLGSTEWVEEYIKNLKERTIAYINVDISVEGTHSLRTLSVPLLYRAAYDAAKQVENPNATEIAAGRKTVYDTWLLNRPWKINGEMYGTPEMKAMGSGSDYAPMIQRAGISTVDFGYSYNEHGYNVSGYPLYHSQYETFYAVKNLVDPEFKYHQAVARVSAEMARNLADSLILPLNVSDYAWNMENLRISLDSDYGAYLRGNISNYDDLQMVIKELGAEASRFQEKVKTINKNDPLLTRMVNDQLMLFEKSFLDPAGLPGRHLKKHMIMAESSTDSYSGSSFPGLVDLLFEIDKATDTNARWDQIRQHFSVILFTIQSAASTLRDVTLFHY